MNGHQECYPELLPNQELAKYCITMTIIPQLKNILNDEIYFRLH
jgi:hypothetical protein